jgi:electron transfer flavoprotein beta subunit
MKIVVCMKRTPDTEAKIRIDASGKAIETTGFEFVPNPYDEYAVEEAVKLKEKITGSEVIVLTVGPKDSATQMRKLLSMGADRGVIIVAETANLDSWATARLLADALKTIEHNIIFLGKLATDSYDFSVGAQLGQMLGLPVVTQIVKFAENAGKVVCEREIEGAKEVVEVSLPAVFTAEKGLNEPRYPKLPDIMKARKKPIEERAVTVPQPKVTLVKLDYPPSRPPGKIVGTGVEAVPALVNLLKNEAKVI